ncbi:hypothetical protein [Streptomyces mirabilis]|uniref:hypothetical protein n=1 Tax=Streptomyces mirabilis TaxID=68239 RepID=UPI00340E6653
MHDDTALTTRTDEQRIWYLATLGRAELLQQLAPLELSTAITHDALACARWMVLAAHTHNRAAWEIAQNVVQPLASASAFVVMTDEEPEPVSHVALVPTIRRRTEGDITGLYAELLLFEQGGLVNQGAYRLSRLPQERHWIIDTNYGPIGASDQPFGSSRLGRRGTLRPAVTTELDRLAEGL